MMRNQQDNQWKSKKQKTHFILKGYYTMDMNNLTLVTSQLESSNIKYALGGSGMLLSLGLSDTINDWDIMTDAPKEQILKALQQFRIKETTGAEYPFGTEYKLAIHENVPQVEILGRFAIYNDQQLCNIPTVPATIWQGVQVSAPEVWYVAYALMERTAKADLLLEYLKSQPANKEVINQLMKEPLPEFIAQQLDSISRK